MSDENGDASGLDGAPDDAELTASDTALGGRLDSIHRTLSTLGMRIDALVTSTTTYRAALTDRLTEYTELVSKLTRAQSADVEEYRQSSERAAAELRRSLTGSEEAMRRVTERIEAMAGDGGDRAHEELLAELRTVQEAQDRLGRFVTESLDRFGDRVVERIAEAQQATADGLEGLRSSSADAGALEEIREALLDVASGEVMGALWDEFRGARSSIDEARLAADRAEGAARAAADAAQQAPAEDPAARLEPLRADVTSLTDAVRDLLAQAEVEPSEGADLPMLNAVATDVAALRNELAQGLVVEPSDALSGAVDQLRADVAALDTRLEVVTDLQHAVAELRETADAAVAAASAGRDTGAVERIESEIARLAEGVGGLDGRLAELDQRLAGSDDGAMAGELSAVRDDLIALGERLGTIAALQEAVSSLRDEVRISTAEPVAAGMSEDLEGELATLRSGVDGVDGALRTVRGGIDEIISRLDEGLVLAEDLTPTSTVPPELADQLAVLRDELASGFDTLRALLSADETVDLTPVTEQLASLRDEVAAGQEALRELGAATHPEPVEVDLAPVTELLEHVRDDIAELPGRIEVPVPPPPPEPEERYAALDPDALDVLREEIRAAGAIPDDLLDQLRQELVALRRRIKLRAEGEILTDEQLELIADAVARRLAD